MFEHEYGLAMMLSADIWRFGYSKTSVMSDLINRKLIL